MALLELPAQTGLLALLGPPARTGLPDLRAFPIHLQLVRPPLARLVRMHLSSILLARQTTYLILLFPGALTELPGLPDPPARQALPDLQALPDPPAQTALPGPPVQRDLRALPGLPDLPARRALPDLRALPERRARPGLPALPGLPDLQMV